MKTICTYLMIFTLTLTFSNDIKSQNWEEQAIGVLPSNYGIFSLSVVDENIVWAVAFDVTIGNTVPMNHITKVLKTTDGGATWVSYDVEAAEGRISFDIVASDENTAFITTQDYGSGAGRGVFKTEDGGTTWEEKFKNPAGGVWIRFFNPDDGVIINRHRIATTQDGGTSWQLVSENDIPPFQSGEFTILSSGNNSCQVIEDHVWFGTNKGRIYRSKDKGNSWEVFNTSLGDNALILSITFRDTLNGIAIDVNNALYTFFSQTKNGGETWEALPQDPGAPISQITYLPGTDSTLIGTSDIFVPNGNRISAYSIDFGKTWEIINTDIAFSGMQFIAPTTGWSARGMIDSTNQAALFKWDGSPLVSTEELRSELNYNISPNPFTDYITIDHQNYPVINFKVYNNAGHLIKSGIINSTNSSLNLEDLGMGIFLLELNSGELITTRKIIKVN